VAAARELDAGARPLYRVRARVRTVLVGAGPTSLLPNSPARIGWRVVNRSVNNGAFDFTEEVTFADSFLVGAAGGTAAMTEKDDGEAVQVQVWAINDAAAGNWRVVEFIRDARGGER
jgi:hypothetical protein